MRKHDKRRKRAQQLVEDSLSIIKSDENSESVYLDEKETDVVYGIGILTYLGLYANGGMNHLYGACSKAILISRSGIGWVLLMGMLLDFVITTFGWWPVASGYSILIAIFWVSIMLTIDRAILRSMDGGSERKTRKSALIMRLVAICLQVVINTGLTMMILMGQSTDKYVSNVDASSRQPYITRIESVQNEFNQWVASRESEMGSLVQIIAQKRADCNKEALNGNAAAGRRAGNGSFTKMCLHSVAQDEADLATLQGRYTVSLETKRASLEQSLRTLNDELAIMKSSQSERDGLYGRVFTMLEAVDRMKTEQPVMVWIIALVDLFILVLQTSPFIMKLSHQSDEYDHLFAREMWAKEKVRLKESIALAESEQERLRNEEALQKIMSHEAKLAQIERNKIISQKMLDSAEINEQALEVELRLARLQYEVEAVKTGTSGNITAYKEAAQFVNDYKLKLATASVSPMRKKS